MLLRDDMDTRKRHLGASTQSISHSSDHGPSVEKRPRLSRSMDADQMLIDTCSPVPTIELNHTTHTWSRDTSESWLTNPTNSQLSPHYRPISETSSPFAHSVTSSYDDGDSISGISHNADFQFEDLKYSTSVTQENGNYKNSIKERISSAVCFGMLSAKIVDQHSVPSKQPLISIQISFEKDIVWLNSSVGEYMGLMEPRISKELSIISKEYPTYFEAFIPNHQKKYRVELPGNISNLSVYIVIYGSRDHRDDIGWQLSNKKLYLQHPFAYDTSIVYDNPHYLLPPGTTLELPQLVNLNLGDEKKKSSAEFVNDALQIFEDTTNHNNFYKPELGPILGLNTTLKDHQKVAVAFMMEKERGQLGEGQSGYLWEAIRSSSGPIRYRNVITGNTQTNAPLLSLGGLIADSMGLGKTLVALAMVAADYATIRGSHTEHLPTLIVAPPSTLIAWEEQLQRHFESATLRMSVYHGDRREREFGCLMFYDIVLTTYDTLVADVANKTEGCLLKVLWRRIILDEAHYIKDTSTKRFKATCALESKYRWCLTGTPIQNRIDDFAALLSFLRVHPFDRNFKKQIIEPLKDANPLGVYRLRQLVNSISLRRTKASLGVAIELPTRKDYVEGVEFSEEERALYEFARKQLTKPLKPQEGEIHAVNESQNILHAIIRLRQICDHNCDLWPAKFRAQFQQSYRGSKQLDYAFFDALDSCEACGESISDNPFHDGAFSCPHILCVMCGTGGNTAQTRGSNKNANYACPLCFVGELTLDEHKLGTKKSPLCQKRQPDNWKPSSKVNSLIKNLRKAQSLQEGSPHKSVVFSCWTTMLDLVEVALKNEEIGFTRIDGSMSLKDRSDSLQNFRNNVKFQVLLASIQCAGVGLDLTAASRVHLLEPQWNPASEEQALDRVHRMGQTRPVETYRYVVKRSIDEYIVALQEKKVQLVKLTFGGESSSYLGLEGLKSLLR